MISIVTAKIIRKNEQYNYRVVGKGERYLVVHEDGEGAGDVVLQYLAPYAQEPVVIEATALQKSTEIIGLDNPEAEERCGIYKASVVFRELLESGKTKKTTRRYYILAEELSYAHGMLDDFLCSMVQDYEVVSISKTNIIECLHN